MIELITDSIQSPIGTIILVAHNDALCALDYGGYEERMTRFLRERFGSYTLRPEHDPCGFTAKLAAYLGGELGAIEDIPVSAGGTPFQQRVWNALRDIAPGTVSTYGQIAEGLGNPGAARAVGLANSLNPVAIVVPCHRVIGASAKLTGYAGGLDKKRWLLEHEGVDLRAGTSSKQRSGTDGRRFESLPLFPID